MTYCLGIRTQEGLIAIADTRITSGNQTTTAKKVSIHQRAGHSLFIMTSGLRSVRDKAVTYFEEELEASDKSFNKLYKATNAFAKKLRQVAKEDKKALAESGLPFNLHAIVGGQLEDDPEPKLFLVYPEANWVEVGEAAPFFIIGNTGFGKPILDRAINHRSSLEFALKTGFLSFDATRLSANDVGFPIDVVLYRTNSFHMVEHRYEEADLRPISEYWDQAITHLINDIDGSWVDKVFTKSPRP